jgi:hypothetical protein
LDQIAASSDLAYSYFGLVGHVTVRIAGAIRMLRQLLVSIAVSVCNIAIHAIVMAAVLWVARVASERAMSHRSFQLIAVMTAMNGVLLFGWSTAVIFAVLRAAMASQTEEGLRSKSVSSE